MSKSVIFVSPNCNSACFEKIVIPRFFSIASVSKNASPLSTRPIFLILPLLYKSASDNVVLPASTCARIPAIICFMIIFSLDFEDCCKTRIQAVKILKHQQDQRRHTCVTCRSQRSLEVRSCISFLITQNEIQNLTSKDRRPPSVFFCSCRCFKIYSTLSTSFATINLFY